MKTEVRDITPSIAKEMLKRNVHNRKLTQSHASFLAREMTMGNWTFDGQPIRLSESGGLLDGQHRLNAIVLSETTQKFLIVTGIKSDAFAVMDTGKNRSGGDVFSINGVANAAGCSATSKIILSHKNGVNGGADGSKISNTELLKFFKNNPKVADYVSTSQKYYLEFNKVLPLTQIAAFRYLMAEKNVLEADNFWSSVCTGLGLEKNSPAFVLRQKLIADKISKSSLPFSEKKALIFKAWNAYRAKQEVKFLRWNKENEKFPELI